MKKIKLFPGMKRRRRPEMVTYLAMGFSSVQAFLWWASAVGMNVLEEEGIRYIY